MNSNSNTLDTPKTTTSAPPRVWKEIPDAEKTPSKWFRPRTVILAVVALAIVAWLTHFAIHAYHYQSTEDAYISGHLHHVSPQVAGRVKSVLADDNQLVAAGDTLVELDPSPFQIAVEKAQSALDQARAQSAQARAAQTEADAEVSVAEAHVLQAQAQLKQLQAQLELARVTLARTEQLFQHPNGAATQADLDQARSSFAATEAAVAAAQANVSAAQATAKSSAASRDAKQAEAVAAEATIATAQAALDDARLQLSYTKIVAPIAGRVGNKAVETGDRVQAGQALFEIAAPDVWIVANFKETQLTRMRPGQPVEITVDALPGEILHGQVQSLSPASGAEFALLPPDNATGNFNKVVQRIPVKITIDPSDVARLGSRLQLGLSVVPEVRVR